MTTYSTPTSNLSVCFVFYFPPFWSNAVDVGNNIYSWKAFSDKLHGVKKKIRMEKGAVYSSRLWTNYDPFTKLTLSPVWCSSQYMTKNSTK